MSERIERIRKAVEQLHNCRATHLESVPVREAFKGQTVWEGVVETFSINGHPKAKRCYGWEIPGPKPDYVAVLGLPPVESALTAVRVALLSRANSG